MVALVQVFDWDTKHPGDRLRDAFADAYLLNTNRMVNIIDRTIEGNSGSQLLFSNNPNDPRDSPDRLFVNLSAAELREYRDLDEFSKFAVLDVYPTLDVTNLGTAVETLIEWENIAYVYMTYNDYTHDRCHVVYYDESWKRKVVIVNHTLMGVHAIALLGNDLD